MDILKIFKRVASQYPESNPKIIELPAGVVMLDFSVQGIRYCAENIPSYDAFGLSKLEGVSPFYEGVDESFSSAEELEARITEMMKKQE